MTTQAAGGDPDNVIDRLITNVVDAGKTRLDTHSPSRVFVELGASAASGLAPGLAMAFRPTLRARVARRIRAIRRRSHR